MEKEQIKTLVNEVIDFTESKTLLTVLISEFKEHKIEDDAHSNLLFSELRELPGKLKKEIAEDMEKNYTSRTDFEVFTTKITWAIVGGMSLAGIITWVLSNYDKLIT